MKKGFTLIELVITISIISIISGIAVISIHNFKGFKGNIYSKYSGNEIISFIGNSREYCRANNIKGYIYIDFKRNRLIFKANSERNEKLQFPKEISLKNAVFGTSNYKILINRLGIITNPGRLIFIDEKGKEYRITISVDTNYVRIKDLQANY